MLLTTVTSLLCLLSLCLADEMTPVTNTTEGQIRGNRITTQPGKGVDVFLGIRYAAPPIGELRFSPPTPPSNNWTGVQIKTNHGARCHERVIPKIPKTPRVPYNEDCLYLDIYAPWSSSESGTGNHGNRSVILYIHGGSFYAGTGALYNFTNVASRGVVVVTINYRLDVFGFLSTCDDVIPGNYGLLDQVAALKWVKKNIEQFGGNPFDITLFGSSSGAASVSLLTLSPKTRGTFQKAIMQSGGALANWAMETTPSRSRQIAGSFGQMLSCHSNTSEDLLKCLRELTADDVIEASVQYQESNHYVGWKPAVDSNLLPETPEQLVNSVQRISIPTLRGYTREDGSYWVTDPDNNGLTEEEFNKYVAYVLSTLYLDNIGELYQAVAHKYLQQDVTEASAIQRREAVVKILTDVTFVVSTAVEAKLFSRCGGQDSYLYEFAHRPSYSNYSQWYGVSHADEKGFVLGFPQGPDPYSYLDADQQDHDVSDLVLTLWTNFAKHGSPTPSPVNNTVWTPYVSGDSCDTRPGNYSGDLYVIKPDPEVTLFDRADKVLFWQKTLPDIAKEYCRWQLRLQRKSRPWPWSCRELAIP